MRRRKRIKKSFKKLLVFILLIVLGFAGFKAYQKYYVKNDPVVSTPETPKNVETWPKTYSINLLATGDTVIHDDVRNYGKKSDGSFDYKPFLTEIKDIVTKYDIAYYNQETVFGGAELGYSSFPRFNTPSEYGDAMLDAGFNTVSLATNHSYDKGTKGVLNSLEYWENTDAMYNGMASSEENRTNYMIKTKNNISYALLSYTYSTNGINVPSDSKYLVNVYSDELAKKDIENLRDKVDVLIVAMHWGVEYTFNPTNTQKTQAEYLASLGVDIVIGNHPHCLQPIEWIDDTLIIYSLGNFISNQGILYSTIGYKGVIGAFATLDINKLVNEDNTSEIKIDNLSVELLYTYKNTNEKYYKVIPFSKMNNNYLNDYKSVYEQYKAVIQKYDSSIIVKPSA